jgi:sugar phosphate isomerase/epimerase
MLQAQRLGATVILGRLGDIPAKEENGDWQVLIDVLTDLGRTGQQAGAFFCAEAGQSAPEDLRRVIEAVPEGSLQVHLVTGALLVHGYDPAEAAMTLATDIGYVHATDAVAGSYAGHGRAVPLGTGQVDVPPVLATLEERGYRGWVGVEAVSTRQAEATRELSAAVNQLVS